jgi:L,D-transpeptidase YcbB
MRRVTRFVVAVGLVAAATPALAQRTVQGTPTELLPPDLRPDAPTEPAPAIERPRIVKPKRKTDAAPSEPSVQRSVQSVPLPPSSVPSAPPIAAPPLAVPPAPATPLPAAQWTLANAESLLAVIKRIGGRGLIPADYEPEALQLAIEAGEGDALNLMATKAFTMLGTDLRDGRTPKSARKQWLVRDTDAETLPIRPILDQALATGKIGEGLASLEPEHPDYARLLDLLDVTPAADKAKIALIRTNLDRWRWMPQSLGPRHLYANIPEFMLRVYANQRNLATYPVIVGKTNTQTPAINAMAQGVVIHPPWYLPRSIINESVGALIARSPATARARGYSWTGSGKTLSVVQAPGPNSALGVIKVDMPNAEAIFIHDTPSRHLFGGANKTLSHGCLRTDRAMELGILLGIIQGGFAAEELADLIKAGKTTKVPFKANIPVFISYFTLGTAVDGTMKPYADVYGRDAPVIASFAKPRAALAPEPVTAPTPVIASR